MSEPATKEDVRRIIREEMAPVWKRVERHDREIYGHNGTPGLTTRTQENTTHRMHIRALWGTLVASIVGWLFKTFGQ